MQDVQQVALDAEKTKVHCELKARCDAVKAERATNGGAARMPRIAFGAVLLATADAQELFQPTGAQGGGRRAMVGATVAERPRKSRGSDC